MIKLKLKHHQHHQSTVCHSLHQAPGTRLDTIEIKSWYGVSVYLNPD